MQQVLPIPLFATTRPIKKNKILSYDLTSRGHTDLIPLIKLPVFCCGKSQKIRHHIYHYNFTDCHLSYINILNFSQCTLKYSYTIFQLFLKGHRKLLNEHRVETSQKRKSCVNMNQCQGIIIGTLQQFTRAHTTGKVAFVISAAPWGLLRDFRQTNKAVDPQKAIILIYHRLLSSSVILGIHYFFPEKCWKLGLYRALSELILYSHCKQSLILNYLKRGITLKVPQGNIFIPLHT